jgi:hypothetical protein
MTTPCAIEQEAKEKELTERLRQRPSWLRPEMLASLVELNERFVDLLALQAMTSTSSHEHPLVHELRPLLMVLDLIGRRRVASCPYLLVDVGFADPQRWLWARGYHVRDGERRPEQYLAVPQTIALARLVFTYSWHLARTHSSAARMLLGMAGRTAEILSTYTLCQITELAELHPHWVQPRWPAHSRMWRELLGAAMKGEGLHLEQARMRGLQLLAAQVRSSASL